MYVYIYIYIYIYVCNMYICIYLLIDVKLFSDVETREIVVTGTTEDDVEALNEKSDKVDSDLEVSFEEEQLKNETGKIV